jgi:hypothetical protein
MKMPLHVMQFAEGNVKPYERFVDYYNHYRNENNLLPIGKKVSFDTSATLAEKEIKMHDMLLAEIARHAGVNFTEFKPEVMANHPTYQWAAFAVVGAMVDLVLPETIIDSIGIYTEIKTVEMGNNVAFECKPRDLFYVTKAGRGRRHVEARKQFNGQVTVTPEEHDITVMVSLLRVLAGKENLAEFAMKAARSMEHEMTYDAFAAFNTYVGTLPTTPSGSNLQITGFTQAEAKRLAQTVSSFNMGAKAVFMGTGVALQSILPDTGTNFRVQIDSDYVKMGHVTTFMGHDVLEIPQMADWKTPFANLLDDNKIYIVSPSSQKILKLAIEGSTRVITDGVFQNADLTQKTTLKKNWAVGVATNAVVGVINIK